MTSPLAAHSAPFQERFHLIEFENDLAHMFADERGLACFTDQAAVLHVNGGQVMRCLEHSDLPPLLIAIRNRNRAQRASHMRIYRSDQPDESVPQLSSELPARVSKAPLDVFRELNTARRSQVFASHCHPPVSVDPVRVDLSPVQPHGVEQALSGSLFQSSKLTSFGNSTSRKRRGQRTGDGTDHATDEQLQPIHTHSLADSTDKRGES